MIIRTLQFRAEVVIYSFADVMPYAVLFFFWGALFQTAETINGFRLPQIINYYLLVVVIERLTDTHFENWRSEEIRTGKIDYFLSRPFSYISEIYSKEIGSKLIGILFSIPVVAIFFIVSSWAFQVTMQTITFSNLVQFLILMLIAHTLQFFIALFIVLSTFWIESSSGFEHFKWITITLFSGAMIPLEFMPTWMRSITEILPLKYIFAVPIGIVQNTYTLKFFDVLYLSTVLLACFLLSKLIWARAQLKYSSAGG